MYRIGANRTASDMISRDGGASWEYDYILRDEGPTPTWDIRRASISMMAAYWSSPPEPPRVRGQVWISLESLGPAGAIAVGQKERSSAFDIGPQTD